MIDLSDIFRGYHPVSETNRLIYAEQDFFSNARKGWMDKFMESFRVFVKEKKRLDESQLRERYPLYDDLMKFYNLKQQQFKVRDRELCKEQNVQDVEPTKKKTICIECNRVITKGQPRGTVLVDHPSFKGKKRKYFYCKDCATKKLKQERHAINNKLKSLRR